MSFRDENDALRARADAAQRELDLARAQITELEKKAARARESGSEGSARVEELEEQLKRATRRITELSSQRSIEQIALSPKPPPNPPLRGLPLGPVAILLLAGSAFVIWLLAGAEPQSDHGAERYLDQYVPPPELPSPAAAADLWSGLGIVTSSTHSQVWQGMYCDVVVSGTRSLTVHCANQGVFIELPMDCESVSDLRCEAADHSASFDLARERAVVVTDEGRIELAITR
jgi:hypothetical protein